MSDYSHIGLTGNKQARDGFVTTRSSRIQGLDFDSQYEVQTNRVKTGKLESKGLIENSSTETATGAFTTGQSVTLETTLGPAGGVDQSIVNMAIPYVAMYQGTIAQSAYQFYPSIGGSISTGQYITSGGFDWHTYDGTTSVFKVYAENVSAGSVDILAKVQWKFIANTSGTGALT